MLDHEPPTYRLELVIARALTVPLLGAGFQELAFAEVDMDLITLWARVPHYVASMPYPVAAAALIDGVGRIAGLTLDASVLRASAEEARQRVDDLVTNNPDHSSMVEQLEEAVDEDEGVAPNDELPSGDELAAELERFLRGEGA